MICNNSTVFKLIPIEESDLPQIQEWRNSPRIQPYVREYRELSLMHVKEWYESIILNPRFEFFIIEADNKSIGVTGLTYIDWVNRHADVHLAIYDQDKWIDDTYGPEALRIIIDYGFNHLNLHKLYAEVYEIDCDKLEFFKSHGFVQDACLRDHYFYKGRYYNSYILSLLRYDHVES